MINPNTVFEGNRLTAAAAAVMAGIIIIKFAPDVIDVAYNALEATADLNLNSH